MPVKTKITVDLTQKSYNLIRMRLKSTEDKTSRVLSRYLYIFLQMLNEGEQTLYKKFTRQQGFAIAETLNRVHHVDSICWEELAMYPAVNLSELMRVFDCDCCVPLTSVAELNMYEILALMEYARTFDDKVRFEVQSARFRA